MSKPLRLLLCCLLLCAAGHAQTTLYVDSSVSSSGTGSSWASAYKTLNEALVAANAASTTIKYRINIAMGTYYPTGAQTGTNRDSTFLIARPGVALWGGYPSGGGSINVASNPTNLSGEIGAASGTGDNSYHVLVIANVTTSSDSIALNGLNISGGNANGTSTYTYNSTLVQRSWGGGMYVASNVAVKLLIGNCGFSANTATVNGGAFCNLGAEMGIISSRFSGNGATGATACGGAIYASGLYGSLDSIAACTFSNNTCGGTGSTSGGGAICLTGNGSTSTGYISYPYINGCSFSGNTSAKNGGAIYSVNTSAVSGNGTRVLLCTFSGNTATLAGGALYSAQSPGGAVARQCTFTGNSAGSGGGAISVNRYSPVSGSGDVTDSCTFTANAATGNGGAVSDNSSASVGNKITGCSFVNNTAGINGGGAYTVNGATLVRRCSFNNNRCGASGGGLYFEPTYATTTLDSSSFTANRAAANGGGLYVQGTVGGTSYYAVIVANCRFTGDTAFGAGGAVASSGSVQHASCGYFGNRALNGGAVYLVPSGFYLTTMDHDTLQANAASANGGGLFITGTAYSCRIGNTLIAGNKAGGKGGAVYDSANVSYFSYTTMAGDTALGAGNGVYNYSASPGILDCIVWEGPASIYNIVNSYPTIQYSIIGGGYTGTGNLQDDPHFVSTASPASAPTTLGNYQLSACSPAIDLANGTTTNTTGPDLAGNSRIYGNRTDMGAYEYQGSAPLTGPNPACLGSTAQYANITSGGTWSLTNGALASISSTGLLTPSSAGTDTIIYTVASGACAGRTYKPVTINTPPSVLPIINYGSDSLCAGSGAVTLYDNTVGGTWTISNSTLAGISGGSSAYITGGIGSGLDTVYYTVTGSISGCSTSVSHVIRVLPLPVIAPISGLDTVCQDRTIQLTNATTGGTWMAPTITVSVSASGLAYGYVPGTGFIEYKVTDANGCSDKATKSVTVLAEPTLYNISGPATACLKGGTFTLSELATGGAWHSLNPAIAVINSAGIVMPVSIGTARFSYFATNAAGCSDSVTKSVTIHTIDNSVTQNGNVLTANYPNSAYYLWLNCDSNYAIISGNAGQTFTATQNGHYAVRVIGDGCADTSACFTVSGLAVKNPGTVLPAITVFPNPASGSFTISGSLPMKHASAYLCDIAGRQLQRIPLSGQKTTVNVGRLCAGHLHDRASRGGAAPDAAVKHYAVGFRFFCGWFTGISAYAIGTLLFRRNLRKTGSYLLRTERLLFYQSSAMQSLILLHGALGTASAMVPLAKALDGFAEVHVLDFSGHGKADWPQGSFSIETFERDVLRLMDANGVEAAHLFGYSMGGFVGLRLAAQYPQRIKSLTTLATKFAWDEATCEKEASMVDADVLEAKVPRFIAMLNALHDGGWRPVVEATQTMLRGMHRYRFSPEVLAAIQTPVRLMLGDRDKMVSLAETLDAYKALPNSSLAILPDTPHPLDVADTDLLSRLIMQMLNKEVSPEPNF